MPAQRLTAGLIRLEWRGVVAEVPEEIVAGLMHAMQLRDAATRALRESPGGRDGSARVACESAPGAHDAKDLPAKL